MEIDKLKKINKCPSCGTVDGFSEIKFVSASKTELVHEEINSGERFAVITCATCGKEQKELLVK